MCNLQLQSMLTLVLPSKKSWILDRYPYVIMWSLASFFVRDKSVSI